MHEKANNRALFDNMKLFMKPDRAKHNIVPPSRFGVVEITRQRVRPETEIKTGETCPTCNGTGEIQASILFAEEIESNIEYVIQQGLKNGIELNVHPYLEAFFTKGLLSKQVKWFLKHKTWVSINALSSYRLLEYGITDKDKKKISY
jgi:ribonuclease G